MPKIYESSFNINSFHAINKDTGNIIQSDVSGIITLNAGDTVVFEDVHSNEYVFANTLIFTAPSGSMRIQLNDNDKYPLYIPAGCQAGVQYMRVYSFTALTNGKLYYDGLVS